VRARVAAVALSGIVTMTMVASVFAFNKIPLDCARRFSKGAGSDNFFKIGTVISMAESRNAILTEPVVVIRCPPYVEIPSRRFFEFHIDIDDRPALPHPHAGSYGVSTFRFGLINLEIIQPIVIARDVFDAPFNISSWQVSNVADIDMSDTFVRLGRYRMDAMRLNANIGTLKNFRVISLLRCILFDQFELSLACIPQFFSGVVQSGSFLEQSGRGLIQTARKDDQGQRKGRQKPIREFGGPKFALLLLGMCGLGAAGVLIGEWFERRGNRWGGNLAGWSVLAGGCGVLAAILWAM
jgi:hypothetical protein